VSIHSASEYKRVKEYFEDLKQRCSLAEEPEPLGYVRKMKMMFWERFLYLSEYVMRKGGMFDFKSFWSKSPMSAPEEDDEPDNI
jgi:hypothetical protein